VSADEDRRIVYVWRLEVTYPAGSREPGWSPPGWVSGWEPDPDVGEVEVFRWPAVHDHLSRSGAETRAELLRRFGATVEVIRSQPVAW
jgi:hypothetical protein